MDERLRLQIWLKAWFWRMVLGAAITWCRFCRWLRWLAFRLCRWMRKLHKRADNLCGWLARKAACDLGVVDPTDSYADPMKL